MFDLPAKNLYYEIESINKDIGKVRIHLVTKQFDYEVGSITLEPTGDGGLETHSGLITKNDYGKGYGFCLYYLACQYAEHFNMKLFSSCSPSEYAQRVWRSKRLNSIFRIVEREDDEDCFEVLGRR